MHDVEEEYKVDAQGRGSWVPVPPPQAEPTTDPEALLVSKKGFKSPGSKARNRSPGKGRAKSPGGGPAKPKAPKAPRAPKAPKAPKAPRPPKAPGAGRGRARPRLGQGGGASARRTLLRICRR